MPENLPETCSDKAKLWLSNPVCVLSSEDYLSETFTICCLISSALKTDNTVSRVNCDYRSKIWLALMSQTVGYQDYLLRLSGLNCPTSLVTSLCWIQAKGQRAKHHFSYCNLISSAPRAFGRIHQRGRHLNLVLAKGRFSPKDCQSVFPQGMSTA